MELFEAIQGRRSVYDYKPDPVSEDALMKILDAATWAPSHRNSQPWEFIRIGPETRKQLLQVFGEMLEAGPLKNPAIPEARKEVLRKFSRDFGGAPAMVAVVSRPPETDIDKPEFPIAAGVAVQNLMLAAQMYRVHAENGFVCPAGGPLMVKQGTGIGAGGERLMGQGKGVRQGNGAFRR